MLKYLIIIWLWLWFTLVCSQNWFAQSFDSDQFQKYWLAKVNNVRSDYDLLPYNLNNWLSLAANNWSDYSNSIWGMSHKKYWSKLYYDYKLIAKRVQEQWVIFGSKAGTKVVENIGWGYIKCTKEDCTDAVIKATESTWKFFMSEKWKKYAPHFNSMISSQYTDAWFGISINWKLKKYYFTAYYSVPIEESKLITKVKTSKTFRTIWNK